MNYQGNADYAIWSDKVVIADCLRKLGEEAKAIAIHTEKYNRDIINDYIKLIKDIAKERKDEDVLDRLYFAGLIYG
jgi:hypothetical protein